MIAAICLLAAGLTMADEIPEKRPVAYVVCGDSYEGESWVYRVDLFMGALLAVSEPINGMGNPDKLAIDPGNQRLYIASMRGMANDYWPVTVVSTSGDSFEIISRFSTASDDGNSRMHEAYEIVVSPDGNELFVAHGGLVDSGHGNAVWDSATGDVLRFLPRMIDPYDLWSPDGMHVARFRPAGERTREVDGQEITERWKGAVTVIDVQTGDRETTYLEKNRGMHPPWGEVESPFIQVHGSGRLLAFDRDEGTVISKFNVQEVAGLTTNYGGITWHQPPVLDDRQSIVLTMRCFERVAERDGSNCLWPTLEEWPHIIEHTFVVVIDAILQTEVTRTEIGTNCTRPVLAYE